MAPTQQRPIDPRQDRQAAEELDDRPPRIEQHAEHQFAHGAAVFAQDGRHAAGADFLHAMQGKPYGMLEYAMPDVELNLLGDLGGVPTSPEVNHDLHHRNDGDGDDRCQQQPMRVSELRETVEPGCGRDLPLRP